MCGIACFWGSDREQGLAFAGRALNCLKHRGPDDQGTYVDDHVALAHLRLSILDLSELGHQPMLSSCRRYRIVFNGEIYNHRELRQAYLPGHAFKSHSDTETILELFSILKEKMLEKMVGMWALVIYDAVEKRIFMSRDRFGQKPLYVRSQPGIGLMLSSEMKPLLDEAKKTELNATAVVEYLALGNYGHLGSETFFGNIQHFPQAHYAWVADGATQFTPLPYWQLPRIGGRDRRPFDDTIKKQLREVVIEAVSSQTLSDVPIGITLSGGIDSSIIAGILTRHYDKELHVFTAQTPGNAYDETRYVDAVLAHCGEHRMVVHRKNLSVLSLQDDLERYIRIQEEPFGDPSIMAHGALMQMAADAGIKVILNGQGADEVFFGYNNMARALMSYQLQRLKLGSFRRNKKAMKMERSFVLRSLMQGYLPGIEYDVRLRSRKGRRGIVAPELLKKVNETSIFTLDYSDLNNVWQESILGVHLPHLVHYDDRNAMACSIEGRSPFLDHRIAEVVARIDPACYLEHGYRKYILREALRDYLPDLVYQRTDKIGFYTPLLDAVNKDGAWIGSKLAGNRLLREDFGNRLLAHLKDGSINAGEALELFRVLCVALWMQEYVVGVEV